MGILLEFDKETSEGIPTPIMNMGFFQMSEHPEIKKGDKYFIRITEDAYKTIMPGMSPGRAISTPLTTVTSGIVFKYVTISTKEAERSPILKSWGPLTWKDEDLS